MAIGDQIPIDMHDSLKRRDVSGTGKRKRTEGTSKKKAIMPLILEEQILKGIEEEETSLMEVERNNPPDHVVREEPVEGCKINFPNWAINVNRRFAEGTERCRE